MMIRLRPSERALGAAGPSSMIPRPPSGSPPHEAEREKLQITAKPAGADLELSRPKSQSSVPLPVSPKPKGHPRESTGSILRRRQKQVDFYRDPTILSRLALNQKYLEAKNRLRRFPQEASVWVAAKRQHKAGYSIRQLPIHICVLNLKRALDPTTRQLLNDLIVSLIVAFPNACRMMDHLSVLPIHMALWYGAAPEVISMCFMAYPESVNLLDKRGRSCTDILKGSRVDDKDRQKTEAILHLKVDFWKRAQMAAKKRLAEADIAWDSSSGATSDDDLISPAIGLITEASAAESTSAQDRGEYGFGNDDDDDDDIEPMAWEQLESRAMALEQVLAEVNEVNFDLTRRIEQLTKTKQELQQTLAKQKAEFSQEIVSLQNENAKLMARLQYVERELSEARFQHHVNSTSRSTSHMDNTSAIHLQALLDDLSGSPKTPDVRRRVMKVNADQHQLSNLSSSRFNDSTSLGESGDFDGSRGASHRSPGYRRRGLRNSRQATASGLEDSIAFEELLEVDHDFDRKIGKSYNDSTTSLTESAHSFKSSQSFFSSKPYIKVLDDNKKLQKELEEISRSYREQRTHLQRLEAYVEGLQGEPKEESDIGDCSRSSSSAQVMDLSHVSEGDEGTSTTCSTCTGPKPLNKIGYASDHHLMRSPLRAGHYSSQDIEFIPSPTPSTSTSTSCGSERS